MRLKSRRCFPGVILPIEVDPEKKPVYIEIISDLKKKYNDRDFVEGNWWDIIMPCLSEHGIKLTLREMAVILLVLRKKAFII